MTSGKKLAGKARFLASCGAIAVGSGVLLVPAMASAATINSLTVDQLRSQGTVCFADLSVSVAGTTADVTGSDFFQLGFNTAAGQRFNFPNVETVTPGSTRAFSVTVSLATQAAPRTDWVINVYDTTSNTDAPNAGPIISTTPIARSQHIAAGGACANVATNQVPNVTTGPDQTFNAPAGASLTSSLTATASDPDGDALTAVWTQTAGPTATIANPNSASTNVTLPSVGQPTVFTFEYAVTDAAGDTSTSTTSITVVPPNAAPSVNAGPDQTVAGGDTVTLAGSATDGDNDPLTTTWVQTGGPSVTLSNPSALNPTFTAPPRTINDRVLTFELRADDGTVVSTDTVEITVAGNEAPNVVVSASPTSGAGNTQFTLDGSGTTDPEGDQIIYIWNQISGPSVTLDSPNAAVTTFTAPPGGIGTNQTLTFQLTAVDTFDESDSETVSVTLTANGAPTAEAGANQDVSGGATVTLDGTNSSDPEGDTLSYSWTQVSGPAVTLSDPDIAQPTFVAPAATGADQLLEFQLEVRDRTAGGGPISAQQLAASQIDTVTIRVLANRGPVADAGADQGPIDAGQTVTLDGTGSTDPDGDTLTYSWVQTGGPSVTLDDASAAQPTFTAPQANGTVTFELTVSDGTISATDSVSIEVRAVGTITIIQQITGTDTEVALTSNLAALTTTLTTVNGVAEVTAQSVPVGTYTVTAADLSAAGIAVTDITCSDSDSTGTVSTRTATIELAAGEDVTCTFTSVNSREAAQVAIYNFLTGRNQLILSHQPDLQRRLDRLSETRSSRSGSVNAYGISVPGANRLPVEASIQEGQARFGTSLGMARGGDKNSTFDIWAEAYFSRATIGQQEADFSIFHIGADVKLGNDVLIGGIVQFDDFSDRDTLEAGEAEGDGWMAGPYITARIAPNLYAEARAAWGTSDNVVSPLADMRDAFSTNRSFYSGSLFGEFELGTDTLLRPELSLRHLSEKQKAYTDSLGIDIPSQTVDQGDISFRPRLSHAVSAGKGWSLRPFVQVEGIYTFGTQPDAALANLLPASFADTFGDFRARIEGGTDLFSEGGFRASVSGFHDGIGADGFSNTGVHLGLSFGF